MMYQRSKSGLVAGAGVAGDSWAAVWREKVDARRRARAASRNVREIWIIGLSIWGIWGRPNSQNIGGVRMLYGIWGRFVPWFWLIGLKMGGCML